MDTRNGDGPFQWNHDDKVTCANITKHTAGTYEADTRFTAFTDRKAGAQRDGEAAKPTQLRVAEPARRLRG